MCAEDLQGHAPRKVYLARRSQDKGLYIALICAEYSAEYSVKYSLDYSVEHSVEYSVKYSVEYSVEYSVNTVYFLNCSPTWPSTP